MAINALGFEKEIEEVENLLAELKSQERRDQARDQGLDLEQSIAQMERDLQEMKERIYSNLSPWEKVQMARHPNRPYSLDYVRLIFDEFFELAGDRLGYNDEAVIGGLGRLNGKPVVVIGHQKGRDLKERQRRNFGSAHAEGFRKALRLAKLAEKYRLPLLSFVDTAGAAADLHAEEMGVSEAIAQNLKEFALLNTPSIAIIIGEGGSGGALGMAVADRVLMLEHSVYSVISPEGCAAILWRDNTRANEAAEALKLTAQSAYESGIIDEILKEPLGGAHRDPARMASIIKEAIVVHLGALTQITPEELVEIRYNRIRRMGKWNEQ